MKAWMVRLMLTMGLIAVGLGTISCVSDTRDKWLRILVDGVPPADGQPLKPGQTAGKSRNRRSSSASNIEAQNVRQVVSVHPPYAARNCTACHKSESLSKLVMEPSKLCLQCHGSITLMHKGKLLGSQKYADLKNAIRVNDRQAVESIIKEFGTTASMAASDDNITPLHIAAAMDRKDIAVMLIGAGARIDARTSGGFTPLHWAASKGAVNVATSLLDAGADINARTPAGTTALSWATRNDFKEMKELLSSKTSSEGQQKKVLPASIVPQAKYIHAPVDAGECNNCHGPHKSEEPHLLTGKVDKLCYTCHEKSDIIKVKGHAAMGSKTCNDCHEPHSGSIKGLLKESATGTGAK